MRVFLPRNSYLQALLLALVAAGSYVSAAQPEPAAPGVLNFHQVNEHLYRGAQPTAEGLRNLARLGVKTVVNLRMKPEQSETEKRAVEKLGMRYVQLPMQDGVAPTGEQVAKALSILNDQNAWPVFVHCAGGRDRTGVVVACYRISFDRWTNQRALDEARRHGIRGVEQAKQRYILRYEPSVAGKGESPTTFHSQ
jgi:tyrosine-protein phosphatase SIW14